jgi:serine protease Do
MFNLNGELLGIVSTYFSRQGGYTNIAFAIPIDEARSIADRLIQDKTIKRGYFGAELLLSDNVARKLGEPSGIFITAVDPESPAAKAGLRPGDLIIGINSRRLQESGELHRFLERSSPNTPLALTLLRNGQSVTANIRLGDQTSEKIVMNNAGRNDAAEKLGLIVEEKGQQIGVLMSYGAARTAGFHPGDTLLSINGKSLKSIKDLNERLALLKENEFVFASVQRENEKFILPLGSKSAIKGYSTRN